MLGILFDFFNQFATMYLNPVMSRPYKMLLFFHLYALWVSHKASIFRVVATCVSIRNFVVIQGLV